MGGICRPQYYPKTIKFVIARPRKGPWQSREGTGNFALAAEYSVRAGIRVPALLLYFFFFPAFAGSVSSALAAFFSAAACRTFSASGASCASSDFSSFAGCSSVSTCTSCPHTARKATGVFASLAPLPAAAASLRVRAGRSLPPPAKPQEMLLTGMSVTSPTCSGSPATDCESARACVRSAVILSEALS